MLRKPSAGKWLQCVQGSSVKRQGRRARRASRTPCVWPCPGSARGGAGRSMTATSCECCSEISVYVVSAMLLSDSQ